MKRSRNQHLVSVSHAEDTNTFLATVTALMQKSTNVL